MVGTFRLGLALLSFVVAGLTCYQALDLSARLMGSKVATHRVAWLLLGACLLGMGLWSTQFVALLARVPASPSALVPGPAAGSLLAALLAGGVALRVGTARQLSRQRWLVGALALGMLIALVHVGTVWSMGLATQPAERMRIAAAWFLLGVPGAACALPVMHAFRGRRRGRTWVRRALVGAAMALLISLLMHLAMSLSLSAVGAAGGTGARLAWMGGLVAAITLLSIAATLAVSELVTRLYVRAQRLSGSVHHLHDQLNHLATHDPLTGLPNRNMLAGWLKRVLVEARDGHGHVAVLYLDLDGFKTINDTLGHSFGD